MDTQDTDRIQNLLNSFFRKLEFGTMEDLPIFINNLNIGTIVPSKMEWRIFKGEDSLSLSVANNAETNTLVSTTA